MKSRREAARGDATTGFDPMDVGEGGSLEARVAGEAGARAPMTIAFEAQRDRPDEGASLSDTIRSEPPEIAFAMKDACHEAA